MPMRSLAVSSRSAARSSRCCTCELLIEEEEERLELGESCELLELEPCWEDEPLLDELWAEAANGSAATADRAMMDRTELVMER